MQTITLSLKKFFSEVLGLAFPAVDANDDSNILLTPATKEAFGHFQLNSALKLAKPLQKNPRQVAQIILDTAIKHPDYPLFFANIEIAGPGFLNLTLTPKYLETKLKEMTLSSNLGVNTPERPQKVIVEFSSPNTAKEMHVGHLRSSIIGECLARTFEVIGHDVLRLNHIGDWGTSFGMLIAYIKAHHPEVLSEQKKASLSDLNSWYKASKKLFDEDENFKKEAQLTVVALQAQEATAYQAWELISDISRKAYQEIYDLLDIHLEERGESFYNPMLADLVQELDQKGLLTLSEGAKCVFIEGYEGRDGKPFPLMVQKSDGGYNYDTTDMAAMKHRVEIEKAERIIVVVDSGQALHFKLVEKASELAGILKPGQTQFNHVGFGLVLGPDGKKFKTRSGETEKLIDLLSIAIEKAQQVMQTRAPDLTQEEKEKIGQAIGIAAVKYADLSCNRIGDYTFSYDKMLNFEGNTACFLLYSYVRSLSILRKVGENSFSKASPNFLLTCPSEIALGLHLSKFPEVVETLAQELYPNLLTDFLYQLANKFNAFFRDCRVEGDPNQASRLFLCLLTRSVFEKGFYILGMPTVDKM